jgi:hypothetical protein
MPLITFGAGDTYGVPTIDANGNAITNPTPVKIMGQQEMSLDFSGDVKELYGQNQIAIAVARGKMKVSGKVKGAQINGAMLNSLFFGQGMSAGTQGAVYNDLTGTAIPGTPYQITPTPPGSGTWVMDLGVLDSNGNPMTRVASAPAAGQYSVSAGVYTFAAADTTKTVFINYHYTFTSASAQKISVQNIAMGAVPMFKMFMQTSFQGKKALVIMYSALAPKLSLFQTKLDDFSVPEIDISAQADSANNVCDIYIQG